jgi:protein O-GlcNAc transferase
MVNVFSFTLFNGYTDKYYKGLLENLDLIKTHFPSWFAYVYIGNNVSEDFVEKLRGIQFVRVRMTGKVGFINTVDRFYAIDEPDVELMMVRDTDSRIHWKDRWAIRDFLARRVYGAHVIRDHEQHGMYMLAGLWGIRKEVLIKQQLSMKRLFDEWTPVIGNSGDQSDPLGFGVDQNFLACEIYKRIVTTLLVHNGANRSYIYSNYEKSVKFPFVWTNDIYCGRVELETFNDSKDPVDPRDAFRKKAILSFIHRS